MIFGGWSLLDMPYGELLDATGRIVEDATPGNETEGKPPPFFKEGDGGAAAGNSGDTPRIFLSDKLKKIEYGKCL